LSKNDRKPQAAAGDFFSLTLYIRRYYPAANVSLPSSTRIQIGLNAHRFLSRVRVRSYAERHIGLATWSVFPYVCPSLFGIVVKRLNVPLTFFLNSLPVGSSFYFSWNWRPLRNSDI